MSSPGATKTLPKRHEIPEALRWRLEDLYPNDQEWEADFRRCKDAIPQLQAFAGTLSQSPAQLAACLKLRDETGARFERLFVYAFARMDEDSATPSCHAHQDRS